MLPATVFRHLILVSIVLLSSRLTTANGDTAAQKFHTAYYLQHERGDFAGAAKLYAEVGAAKDATAEQRSEAKAGLAACQEEVAASDLARLMPPAPLAYLELNRPGERLGKLLDQLGLLARPDQTTPVGQNRLAISPALVDALLGVRGVAVAITGFDPSSQRPSGVAVLHPGNMEVVRGMIETALPAAAEVVEPVSGLPTYQVEGVYVTITARLIVAASSPTEIDDVLDRMKSPSSESLAANPQMAEILKDRRGELLFFCVNPKPLLPMIELFSRPGAGAPREIALAQAALDPKSLQALTGRMDISNEGLNLELTLRLDEGHRNLVYNFLRRPAIDRQSLRCVPAGAAAFVAVALNEAPAKYTDVPPAKSGQPPIVTALDLGREIFANINGIAVCLLPPNADARGSQRIPDVAAAITVNDPAKSEALWQQLLGLASLASGALTMDGTTTEVAGTTVRSYRFNDELTIRAAITGHYLFMATSDAALGRSLDAVRSGKSVLEDPALAAQAARLGPNTTLALWAHAGRCVELARAYVPPTEVADLGRVGELLTNTSAVVTIDHSDRLLRLSAQITGVPNVSGLVNQMLGEQKHHERAGRELARAIEQKQWNQAVALIDRQVQAQPDDASVLRQKFDILAIHQRDDAAASALGDQLVAALGEDALALNNFAWALLTEAKYGRRFNELALALARRSNELTGQSQWAYLDTLALAEFELGNTQKAIALEQKAIETSKTKANGAGLADLEQALRRFQGTVRGDAQ